jgi:hypothetical protein
MRSAFVLLLTALPLAAAGVTVRFDPSDPAIGPFPSDALTLPDPAQKTSLRVNLPLPDCGPQDGTCNVLSLINQIDGFNLLPRLVVRFSGRVNPDTLRDGIYFVALENLTDEEYGVTKTGQVMYINQLVYDPDTDTVYAKPDAMFDQHRRYALVVTDAVRDPAGNPVAADPAFSACLEPSGQTPYCAALAAAVGQVAERFAPAHIVGASFFTTLSTTVWMEKARTLLDQVDPQVAPVGEPSVFAFSEIRGITLHEQTGAEPEAFSDFTLPVDNQLFQGVGRVAFGSFVSPQFLNDQQMIPPQPTGVDVPLPSTASTIPFVVWLPSQPAPSGGYPVVIYGHGLGDNRFGGPTAVAPTLNRAGIAVIAINAVGHGFGPKSNLTITTSTGSATIPAGGRSLDLNHDGAIEATEGCLIFAPVPVALRDCLRQTAIDLMQLTRAISKGIDVDGDGTVDLDAGHIYYGGDSLGSLYGTIVSAVEPRIRASALTVGGGSVIDLTRWSPSYHSLAAGILRSLRPTLLNQGDDFNENYVLRYLPVKVNQVAGAIEIQNHFELLEWLQAVGDPIPYAPHLLSSTLPGVPIKPVLWQYARGDRTVPNPANTALVRAANMRQTTWIYRHDLARQVLPTLPLNPHAFLLFFLSPDSETVELPDVGGLAVSIAAQQQIAGFFASDGATIPDPNIIVQFILGQSLFEHPDFLPEDLGF